ncbi:hypothetical membrane protein [Corynebacterium renale]|uniref:Uncharacterized protein n=1 Tax=Corynebacterium renale TaxID=1724 RepID=A0A2A9DLA6_9CORY|nr:hypothetical protein [Corynebacterium renale]PFG27364.1 hypothetical protein ATK06_0420 [Corynebacterium renale]SQG63900.1 hypothetical membrane protein [Corynebacterium renale]SQI23549.1 hypothetical membrane protein [Corynebacterium renale]STD02778.1 hypothetical membrane protein [Corynebacterium renale]
MSSSNQAVAHTAGETFPAYSGSLHYVEGYDPVSYEAPHSSLHKTATWVGMGVALASLFFMGMALWAFSIGAFGNSGEAAINWQPMATIGVIGAIVFIIAATILIKSGRKDYHAYRKATGRVN